MERVMVDLIDLIKEREKRDPDLIKRDQMLKKIQENIKRINKELESMKMEQDNGIW